jgi:hypothetical protein
VIRDGSLAPFARTRAERLASGDPRPSLEERYGTSARYASRIETVTRALVQMRLLLPEGVERFAEAPRSRRPVTSWPHPVAFDAAVSSTG